MKTTTDESGPQGHGPDGQISDADQLDLGDRRAVDAVSWSRRFSLLHLTVLVPGLGLGLMAGATRQQTEGWMIAGWFGLLIMGLLVFCQLARKNHNSLPDVDAWRRQVLVYALACGMGWGACGYFLADASSAHWLFIQSTITLAAVVAGTMLLAFSLIAQLLFALPAIMPILVLAALDNLLNLSAGLAVLATLVVMMITTSRGGGLFDERSDFRIQSEDAQVKARDADELRQEAEGARERMAAERNRIREEMGELSRQAQQAALAKDEFLATMSHEIRTPLNGIIPLLDLMRGSKLDEDQRAHMSTILSSSRHLLSIIDGMLDYSKMQAGKLELETVGFNLSDLLDSVTKLLAGSASRKNIVLSSQIESNVRVAVRGDPVRLRQVITNLVSNAVKFTEKGGVDITVSACAETVAEYRLRFSIVDTGIGMDEATIAKLFQPFTQADASVTRNFGGSGLGLVICKQMVELMGGEIGVSSRPGEGSEFWFEIPLKKAVGDIAPEARRLAGLRMLLVSDDETFGKRGMRFAQNSGCNVELATNPQQAVEKVKQGFRDGGYRDIDILAIDATSTGPQGLVLARKVGSHPKMKKACLIFNAGGQVPSSLEELPSVAAVTANCSTEDLVEAIAGLTKRARQIESVNAVERAVDSSEFVEPAPIAARVLLVEDNHINLNVASSLMESLGLEYDIAHNGREALTKMERGNFDAVLMDCMMPVLDGYSASRLWRELEQREDRERLPIIAMTANAMSGDMEKCLEAGMDVYLSKPLDRLQIADVIRRLTGGEEPASDLQHAAPEQDAPAALDVDVSTLQSLTKVMGTRVHEVIDSYVEESPAGVQKIRNALDNGTLVTAAAHAHELKSTSANLGLLGVKRLCQTIESAAGEGDTSSVEQTLRLLTPALERATRALRQFESEAA